jgi:hypothetical protein
MNAANRQTLQNDAHNHTRDALAHALANTGTLLVKTEVKASETPSINSSGLRTSNSQRIDITGKKNGDTVHTDISLCQYAASGVIKTPARKTQDYFENIRDARAACASTALDPVQKSMSRSGNKKAKEKIRKYHPCIQTKNNHKNATGSTSFCPAISSSNATLHPSSLNFIKAVVAMDTDARGPPHIREAALRATMRNSILTHAALYRYRPAEQSYCYVRHYGAGQASAESDTQRKNAVRGRDGALRTLPRPLSRLQWFVNPTSIVSSSCVF